jgi:hypothetical protein
MIKKISLAVIALLTANTQCFNIGDNPGMMMRIENKTVENLKRVAHQFLPYLFSYDFLIPKSHKFEYKTLIPGLEWDITWSDIKYETFDLDLSQLKLEFT